MGEKIYKKDYLNFTKDFYVQVENISKAGIVYKNTVKRPNRKLNNPMNFKG